MRFSKEEADALRRCVVILAQTSPAHERRTMAVNIEKRISGQETGLLAFKFTQLASLFHPSDTEKSQLLAQQMQAAADAGELVTILPSHVKGALISDLGAWPDCPPIPEESPLRYWLPFMPIPAQVLNTKTPTPMAKSSASAGDEEWKDKARSRAYEIIKSDKEKDLYPSQIHIADVIAREFRRDGLTGVSGKPLTGAYIKRHALGDIKSAQDKLLSTLKRRGK